MEKELNSHLMQVLGKKPIGEGDLLNLDKD
jgi:hypothetical protein